MLRDKEGNRLFRKVQVKVIFPDKIFPDKTVMQHAGPHQGFGPSGIDDILMKLADQLDTLYPFWEFRSIELKPEGRTARYVFTFAGYRAVHGVDAAAGQAMVDQIKQNNDTTQTTESSTLEPETAESITPTAIQEAVGTTLQELAVSDTSFGESL